MGGGHNGLVAAAYLARAGRRVIVLERRPVPGGAVATEEIVPGFRASTGADVCGLLRPEIMEDLDLSTRGVQFLPIDPEVLTLGGSFRLRIWRDVGKTQSELATKSPRDAEAYPRFVALLRRFAAAIEPLLTMTPPNVANPSLADQMGLLRRALAVRRLGKDTMQQFLRVPPMPVRDFLNEWFETDLLKASLAVDALLGTFQGPWSPGTAFGLI
ncbi:MAG: NAD(P)/FAD-dependent oxidoreductase, partial [Methanobacteriota archaeon]